MKQLYERQLVWMIKSPPKNLDQFPITYIPNEPLIKV